MMEIGLISWLKTLRGKGLTFHKIGLHYFSVKRPWMVYGFDRRSDAAYVVVIKGFRSIDLEVVKWVIIAWFLSSRFPIPRV
jgi:hypothetical protein